jgi:hypothetical protein
VDGDRMTTPFDDIQSLLGVVSNSVQQTQNAATTSQLVGYRNPTWVCRYPVADVTFPEIMNLALLPSGSTGAQTAGTAHTHSVFGTTIADTQGFSNGNNTSAGGYLTVSRTVVMDTLAVNVWKASGTINNVYITLFKENADLSLTQVFESTDISASLTTSAQYFEFTITGGLAVQAGSRYVIRCRNASSVATSSVLLGLEMEPAGEQNISFATSGATLSNQTSYTAAQAATAQAAGTSLPWAMLAYKGTNLADKSFNDNFDRSALGGDLWLTMSSWATQLGISEIVVGGFFGIGGVTSGVCAYQGTTNGTEAGIYLQATSSDHIRVDGNLVGTIAATPSGGLLICSAPDMSNLVYLGITSSTATIYSGAWNSLTSQASISQTGNDGIWSIYYDPVANAFTALFNGNTVALSWTDSGNLITHGAGHRLGGILINRASSVNGPSVDNFNVRDWSP